MTVSPTPSSTVHVSKSVHTFSTVQQEQQQQQTRSIAITITPMDTEASTATTVQQEATVAEEENAAEDEGDLVFDLEDASWGTISCCSRFFCLSNSRRAESYQNYWQYLVKEIGGSNLVFLLLSNLAKKNFDFYQASIEKRPITKKTAQFLRVQKENILTFADDYKRILQVIQRIYASIKSGRREQVTLSPTVQKEEQLDSMGSMELDLAPVHEAQDPYFSVKRENSPTAQKAEGRLKQLEQQERRRSRAIFVRGQTQKRYATLTVLPSTRALVQGTTHTIVEVEVALRKSKYKDQVQTIAEKIERFSDLMKRCDKGLNEQPVWLTSQEIGDIVDFSRGEIDTSDEPITPNTSLQIPSTLVHTQPSPLHYGTLDSPTDWKQALDQSPQQPRLSISQVTLGINNNNYPSYPTIAQLPQTTYVQSQSCATASSTSAYSTTTATSAISGICRTSHSYVRS